MGRIETRVDPTDREQTMFAAMNLGFTTCGEVGEGQSRRIVMERFHGLATAEALLDLVRERWTEYDGLVQTLPPDLLERPVFAAEAADPWRVRDVISHLAGWRRNALAVARAQLAPDSEPFDGFPTQALALDLDTFNHELYERWRDAPWPALLEEHRASHEDLLAALRQLPADRLMVDGRPVRWLMPAISHTAYHMSLHLPR